MQEPREVLNMWAAWLVTLKLMGVMVVSVFPMLDRFFKITQKVCETLRDSDGKESPTLHEAHNNNVSRFELAYPL